MSTIPHLGYIVAAYAVAAAVLAGMIAAVWADYHALSAQLESFERKRLAKEGGFR